MVLRESEALRALQGHPNIVRCLDCFQVNANCEIGNQSYKLNSKSFGCDFDAIASYSQEGAIASDKDCGNTNAQHAIKTTEIGAGKGIRRMHSRVGIADKHTDRLCGDSRICLVMELLEGGTLVVSHVVVFLALPHTLLSSGLPPPAPCRTSSTPSTMARGKGSQRTCARSRRALNFSVCRREAFARDVVHTLLDIAAYIHERDWVGAHSRMHNFLCSGL